jgi:hypothetical protein
LVTFVALRTTSASASARSTARSAGERPLRASTFHPSPRSKSRADAGRSSATMIFIACMIPYLCQASKTCRACPRTINGATRLIGPERAALHQLHMMISTRFSTEYVDRWICDMAI